MNDKTQIKPEVKHVTFTDNASYFELAKREEVNIRRVEFHNDHKDIYVVYEERPKKRKRGRPRKKVTT